MAKQERISAQEVLETISGFMELLDEDKLKKLDKLDDLASMKTKLEDLESKITQQGQKISEFVKPEDFEEKIGKRDEAFSEIIKNVPTKIGVRLEPLSLKEEHVDILDKIKILYEKADQQFSIYCHLLISKKMWFLYLFLTAVLSVGATYLVMNDSSKEWAQRALVAAIDMNHHDPIGQYLTCRSEMPQDRKGYKEKVMKLEYDAKKILYLESILADYIDGEFCVEQYKLQQTKDLVYAAVCRLAGSKGIHVYNIHIKDDKVVEVTRRYENTKKKKKDDPEFVWKEVKPIID